MSEPNIGSKILYRSATGLEKALAEVDATRITDIQAELIRSIWDPDTCPENLLPYLAFAMGVEYWNDNWSITTKRTWIATQWLFKSLRGTEAGLKMAVRFAGRDVSPFGYSVIKVTTRPQVIHSGPSLTREQREAWLQQLPQVDVWNINESGVAKPWKAFYGSSKATRLHNGRLLLGGHQFLPITAANFTAAMYYYPILGVPAAQARILVTGPNRSAAYAIPSTALQRLRKRARWVEHGVETNVRVDNQGSFFQLHKSGIEDGSVFSNKTFGLGRHYIPSTAHNRLITIEPKPLLPWRSAMTPSLQTVTSEPERVVQSGTRKHSVFSNTIPYKQYYAPTTAPLRIFQRYAVLDPSVRELRRPPTQFMGTGRYGFPAFTAWADVTVSGKIKPWNITNDGYYLPKTKFYTPHDGRPMEQVRLAAQASKSLTDKIMLRTGPQPRFLAGEKPVLADIDVMLAG